MIRRQVEAQLQWLPLQSDTFLPRFSQRTPQQQRILEAMASTLSVINVLEMQLALAIAITLCAGPVLASLSWKGGAEFSDNRACLHRPQVRTASANDRTALRGAVGSKCLHLQAYTRGGSRSSRPSPCHGQKSHTNRSCTRQQEIRGSDLSVLALFKHPTRTFREAHSSHAPLRAHQPAVVSDRNQASIPASKTRYAPIKNRPTLRNAHPCS